MWNGISGSRATQPMHTRPPDGAAGVSAANPAMPVAVRNAQARQSQIDALAAAAIADRRGAKLGLLRADPAAMAALEGSHVWRTDENNWPSRQGEFLHIGLLLKVPAGNASGISPAAGVLPSVFSRAPSHLVRVQKILVSLGRRSQWELAQRSAAPPQVSLNLEGQADYAFKPALTWNSIKFPVDVLQESSLGILLQTLSEMGESRGRKRVPFTQSFADVLGYELVHFTKHYLPEALSQPAMALLEQKYANSLQRGKELAAMVAKSSLATSGAS
jgi:hypothetical protein